MSVIRNYRPIASHLPHPKWRRKEVFTGADDAHCGQAGVPPEVTVI